MKIKLEQKKNGSDRLKDLVDLALQLGAKTAKIIPADKVVVDERVRLKCEVPRCIRYGRCLTCPPQTMDVHTFARVLSRFTWCLLIQVEVQDIDSRDKKTGRINKTLFKKMTRLHRSYKLKLLEIIEAVESMAFKKGLYFATGLTGGGCVLCEQCVDNPMTDPCRHPFKARPAMEGVGIDVHQTSQNAGLSVYLSSSRNVLWTGLVLLE